MSHYWELPVQIAKNKQTKKNNEKRKISKSVCIVLVKVSPSLASLIPHFPSPLKSNLRAHTIKGHSEALRAGLLDVHLEEMMVNAYPTKHAR